jgi:hypothetical protein
MGGPISNQPRTQMHLCIELKGPITSKETVKLNIYSNCLISYHMLKVARKRVRNLTPSFTLQCIALRLSTSWIWLIERKGHLDFVVEESVRHVHDESV